MKTLVQSFLFFTTLFLLSSPASATQNLECENESSPFIIEVGVDTAFVVNKESFEIEKVLPQVPRKREAQSVYETKNQDWTLRLSKDHKTAQLKVGDSDEVVSFSCDL